MKFSETADQLPDDSLSRSAQVEVKTSDLVPVRSMTGMERAVAATDLVNALHDRHDKVESYVILKNMIDVLEQAVEIAKDPAIGAMKTGKGVEVKVLGATVMVKGLAKKYEYDDPILDKMGEDLKALQARIKDRKDMLVRLKTEYINEETGEVTTPAKLIEDGITIAVTLPK